MEVCDDWNDCYRSKNGGAEYMYSPKVDGDQNWKKEADSNVGWSSTRGVYACGVCVFVLKIVIYHFCQLDRERGHR